MNRKKKTAEKRIAALGWKDGTVAEFLKLTPEESALIEIKLALSRKLRERRQEANDASTACPKTSVKPVARGEGGDGDSSVSIELLVRAILATGATAKDVGRAIANNF